jgi:hypothetical protein
MPGLCSGEEEEEEEEEMLHGACDGEFAVWSPDDLMLPTNQLLLVVYAVD